MALEFIIWILFIVGGAYITSTSEMGAEFRHIFDFKQHNWLKDKLHYLVNCIICSSFWVSLIGTLIWSPTAQFDIPIFFQYIANGILAVGATFIVYKLIPKDLFE